MFPQFVHSRKRGSKDKKIHVAGPATIAKVATNADVYVAQWWIDLRDEDDLAKKFKEGIQDLVEKLATRSRLMAPERPAKA